MKTVNIAELKNHLSAYLNQVKAGEEITVRDRDLPVARIVPFAGGDQQDDDLRVLAAQGKIRLGENVLDEAFWKLPAPKVSPPTLRDAVEQERDED